MPPQLFFDVTAFNYEQPLFDLDAIRRVNPQRDVMEQLTAVVHVDTSTHSIVGYKDITDREFWVTGHMPDFPLMPGVIMCECAAQLASFYCMNYDLLGGEFVGFGGMQNVDFRQPVYPNSRLIIMARIKTLRRNRRAQFEFQGVVNGSMVFNGEMFGVPISRPGSKPAPPG